MNLINANIENELMKCTHCGTCRAFCTTFASTMKESYNSRGRIFLFEGLHKSKINVSKDLLDRIYSCSMCKACEEACPSSVEFTDIMKLIRTELVNENIGPLEEHIKMANAINDTGNIFGKIIKLSDIIPLVKKLPDKSPNLLFLGCNVASFYPELAINMIKILIKANYNFTVMKEGEYCCSAFPKLVGLENISVKSHDVILKKIAETDASNIITLCPFCYGSFYELIKRNKLMGVKHTTELLLKLVTNKKIVLSESFDATVTYLDPCHLGRYHGLYDIPRTLIRKVPNIKFVEMRRNRESSMCCGGTIRVPYFDIRSGMSEIIVKNAYEAGAEYIITACPSCLHNLNTVAFEYDITVCNIEVLIAYSMGIIKQISE